MVPHPPALFNFDPSPLPHLPPARGALVTGADFGVGKTIVAAALAGALRRRDLRVEVFKPIALGCRRDREGIVSPEAEMLALAADSRLTLQEIAPVRYLSQSLPTVAAQREKRQVDWEAIVTAYGEAVRKSDCVVVEGVGGLLCPLTDTAWFIHLARRLNLPLVIVSRSGLGAVNQLLPLVHAARTAKLRIAGVVLNRYEIDPTSRTTPRDPPNDRGDVDLVMHTNPDQIRLHAGVDLLAFLPDEPENSLTDLTVGPGTQFAIDQAEWTRILRLNR